MLMERRDIISNTHRCLINLPHRTDKLDSAVVEIRKVFDIANFFKIDGVIEESPYLGIAQAHMNCIAFAKEAGLDRIIIMEDDIEFRQGAKEYAIEAFNNIPNDWDILLGGLYTTDKLTPYNEYWQRTNEFAGLHFYMVNSKAYDTILNFKKNMHIDRFMAGQGKLNCYVTNKFFAVQKPGHSDNVGMFRDYSDYLTKFDLL